LKVDVVNQWLKARSREQCAYIEGVAATDLPCQLYARTYTTHADAYNDLEVLAAAQALNVYRETHGIGDKYKVIIAIDGLAKGAIPRVGRSFRLLGIRTRNVHGERDQASPIIRLADAIAGVVREAHAGKAPYKDLQAKLERRKKLYEL
jgi:hypothetical protein